MTRSTEDKKRKSRGMVIVSAYPIVVLLIGITLNLFVFEVNAPIVALPAIETIRSLIIAAILLIINHSWIMTATELTRIRFKMYSTPEEWDASESKRENAPEEGIRELERHHNTHRNTTENTVYFILLALIFAIISPSFWAAQVWIVGFSIARLGYTYSYLAGKDNLRGLFMTLSLLSMYGMASYLAISLIV